MRATTISDLINSLEQFPPEAEIFVEGKNSYQFSHITKDQQILLQGHSVLPEIEESNLCKQVKRDLTKRDLKGQEEYSTSMDRKDLSKEEWLEHLYEELLDGAQYAKKALIMVRKDETAD